MTEERRCPECKRITLWRSECMAEGCDYEVDA